MITRKEMTLIQWNAAVQRFPHYSFYNSPARIEYLQKGLRRSVTIDGFYQDTPLVALLQTQFIPAKRGSFLYVQHSPLVKGITKQLSTKLFERINEIANERKATFIRMVSLIPEHSPEYSIWQTGLTAEKYAPAPIHEVDACITQLVPLHSAEQMLQAMRKTTRYEIRQAEKDTSVSVHISADWQLFDRFYQLYHHALANKNYTAIPADFLAKELHYYAQAGMLQFAFAQKDRKDIATGVFITYGKYCTYYLGAIDPEFSRSRATYKILWQMMQWAHEEKYALFDLWGGMHAAQAPQKHPWTGIHQFKEGFGGTTMHYQLPMDKPLSTKYWLTYLYEWAVTRQRKYR